MTERSYAKGGVVTGPTSAHATVKVRKIGDLTEYWEPAIGAWVPVYTQAQIKERWAGALDALNEGEK